MCTSARERASILVGPGKGERGQHGQRRQADAARQDLQRKLRKEAARQAQEIRGEVRVGDSGERIGTAHGTGPLAGRPRAEASVPAFIIWPQAMTRTWLAFVAVVFSAVFSALSAGCSERFDWRELRTDAGLVAMLPGRPQAVTRDIAIGAQRAAMTIWSSGVGPTIFAVGAATLPPPAVQDEAALSATLGFFRDALVRNIGAGGTLRRTAASAPPGIGTRKLLAAEEFEAQGQSGPDGRKSRLAARMFIVDDRFFQVVALGAEGEIPPSALDTFFSSFRLTP